MSIPVPLTDLARTAGDFPWGYVVTVGDDGRAHAVAVPLRFDGDAFRFDAGGTTRRNAAARAEVTLVCPPVDVGGFSLIVDGRASVAAERPVVVTPSAAVLHRPAIAPGAGAPGLS